MTPPVPPGRPLLLAHRGDHRRWIENTADALIDACSLPGVDGVEFDVRVASDGEPMVLHDETLERTFGRRVVARDVRAIDLMKVGVPHLGQILRLLPADAFLDIEIKEAPTAATFDAITGARGSGLHRAVVSSFEPSIVAEVQARQPGWSCWLNAPDLNTRTIAWARALRCAGLSVHWSSVDGRTVASAAAAGLAVATWTVRRRPTRRRLESLQLAALMVEGPALSDDAPSPPDGVSLA